MGTDQYFALYVLVIGEKSATLVKVENDLVVLIPLDTERILQHRLVFTLVLSHNITGHYIDHTQENLPMPLHLIDAFSPGIRTC